jgi:hypothetical protein
VNGVLKSSLLSPTILDKVADELINISSLSANHSVDQLVNLYPYGSRVYGCAGPQSDYDMIAVYDSVINKTEFLGQVIHVTAFNEQEFRKLLAEHEINVIECVSLPDDAVLINKNKYDLSLSLEKLRRSVSENSSHSFVKAKKKLTVEKDLDPYRGKKSLFHAFRIVMFGCQVAKHKKVIDFTEANHYWKDIVLNECNDWAFYHAKYKPEFNAIMTEFRKLAPKEQP